MIVSFFVPGEPIGQPRPRATIEKRGYGRSAKYFPRLYECEKDHPVIQYKQAIRGSLIDKWSSTEPMQIPLCVEFEFVMARPKTLIWKTKEMPRVVCRDVPDLDNCCKAVLDALSTLVWRDDRQVYAMRAAKWYASGDELHHTKVTIYTTFEEFHESSRRSDG